MPNIKVPVPEVQQSVLRPIVMEIVRQINFLTKIPNDVVIMFPNDSDKVYQPGSLISDKDNERSLFLNDEIVHIEVEEQIFNDNVLSTPTTRPENIPVFVDNKIGVVIRPIYTSSNISVNFKFRSRSKTVIERWRADMQEAVSSMRDINLHKISYHYLLPYDCVRILKEIHRLRETVAPYDQDFDSYLLLNASTRLTKFYTQTATLGKLGISETQTRIIGTFDFDSGPPKPEKDEGSNTFIGSFTYNWMFQKPISCNMTYPVMVHNQLLNTDFVPDDKGFDEDDLQYSRTLSFDALSYFEKGQDLRRLRGVRKNIVIPPQDEFIPTSIPVSTASIFSALCQLTIENKRTLLNLKELGDVIIDLDVMEFIEKCEYPYMTKAYQSILQVNLYRSMNLASDGNINITPTLDVVATADLNIRVNNRIRFSVVADLGMLNRDAIDRLKKYPKAMVKILGAINDALKYNPWFIKLGGKSYITKDDLLKFSNNPLIANMYLFDSSKSKQVSVSGWDRKKALYGAWNQAVSGKTGLDYAGNYQGFNSRDKDTAIQRNTLELADIIALKRID